MSLLFPNALDLSSDDHEFLAAAYEKVCDELVANHDFTSDKLICALDGTTGALLALYRAGQRDDEALCRYAASKALDTGRGL